MRPAITGAFEHGALRQISEKTLCCNVKVLARVFEAEDFGGKTATTGYIVAKCQTVDEYTELALILLGKVEEYSVMWQRTIHKVVPNLR